MKKGITPIIAVIILLLITVALAGMAWAFLSGYLGGLMGKNIQIADSYCLGNTQAKVVITNIGTDNINIGATGTCDGAGSITLAEKLCGDIVISRTDTGGTMYGSLITSGTSGSIAPKSSFTFTDANCTTTTIGTKICAYRIRAGSSGVGPNVVTVSCSG